MPRITQDTHRIQSVLRVDALYYHAARAAYARAVAALPAAKRKQTKIERLQKQFERVNDDVDAAEPIAIRLEREEEDLHSLYAPLLEGFALVHLLSAASLEAHINEQGYILLSGAMWDHFEKLNLEAKWLFLPKLCRAKGFVRGEEPFQGFTKLIKYRNALAHYKPRAEDWQPPGIPHFIETLGLTEAATKKSLETVRGMVRKLAVKLRLDKSYWLKITDPLFLAVEHRSREGRRNEIKERRRSAKL